AVPIPAHEIPNREAAGIVRVLPQVRIGGPGRQVGELEAHLRAIAPDPDVGERRPDEHVDEVGVQVDRAVAEITACPGRETGRPDEPSTGRSRRRSGRRGLSRCLRGGGAAEATGGGEYGNGEQYGDDAAGDAIADREHLDFLLFR